MAIYLKVSSLNGNVTTQDYKNWINIHDLDFSGVSRNSHIRLGNVTGRNNNSPHFGEITVVKSVDSSSNAFLDAVTSNHTFSELEFHRVSDSANSTTYGKIILNDVIVTHYSNKQNQSSQRPQELVRFAYTKIQQTVIPIDENNNIGSPDTTGYNIETAEKM